MEKQHKSGVPITLDKEAVLNVTADLVDRHLQLVQEMIVTYSGLFAMCKVNGVDSKFCEEITDIIESAQTLHESLEHVAAHPLLQDSQDEGDGSDES